MSRDYQDEGVIRFYLETVRDRDFQRVLIGCNWRKAIRYVITMIIPLAVVGY